jgi:holo-[acyl-carrier protein] synthase
MTGKKQTKVGIDLVEVLRFKKLEKYQLEKFFFEQEREYCFSFQNPYEHFAGFFAAKEAVSKALGVMRFPFSEIEIRHLQEGAPVAYHKNKKLDISLSIAHTKDMATAIAIA